MRSFMSALAFFLLVSAPVATQQTPTAPANCPPGTVGDLGAALQSRIDLLLSNPEETFTLTLPDRDPEAATPANAALAALADPLPLTSPPATQVGAPSNLGASGALVDQPGFPALLGFAIDTGLVSSGDEAVTFDLNLFALRAALQPDILDRPLLYADYSLLRRWGGSFSFGKQGESFDRDGDGQADPALDAEEIGDILDFEVLYRFRGSRDRKDRLNVKKYEVVRPLFVQRSSALHETVFGTKERRERLARMSRNGCFDAASLETFLNEPVIEAELQHVVEIDAELRNELQKVNSKIDKSMIWTAVLGGTQRRPEFGPDRWKAAIRGAMGPENNQFTLNGEWSWTEGLRGAPDPKVLKLAAAYSRLLWKGILSEGVTLAGSASWESFQDVPDATHDTNSKANVKLEFPLLKGVRLPISVTWANHKDLITDEDELRGHIGFTIDWKELQVGRSRDE